LHEVINVAIGRVICIGKQLIPNPTRRGQHANVPLYHKGGRQHVLYRRILVACSTPHGFVRAVHPFSIVWIIPKFVACIKTHVEHESNIKKGIVALDRVKERGQQFLKNT
jgi:hypothetical protein